MKKRIQQIGVLGVNDPGDGHNELCPSRGRSNLQVKVCDVPWRHGAGDTPAGKSMKVSPFAKMSEADMVTIITNGKGKMPAYKGKLTDAQIKEVAAYSPLDLSSS